jgi:hypothetical protein
MDFPHRFARLGISRSRHRTGIQHNDVCLGRIGAVRQSLRKKPAAKSNGVRIRGAAAKIFDEESFHSAL